MKPATTKKAYVLFPLLLSIAFIFVYTNSYRILDYPPSSVHMWRQSDCAASIKTFFRTDNSVFEPATLNLAGKDGRVASEFPIFYYITAKIQHVVGEHYWIIRSMNFLSYLIGLWALVDIIKRWINDKLLTFTLFILLATSPYYYYYAINLLPNVPAISFSFVGLYFFLKYDDYQKIRHLVIGTLAFILATALKPTDGGVLWLAFVGAKFIQVLTEKRWTQTKKEMLSYLFSSIVIAISIYGWMQYVNWYNDTNGNHQNLIGILPFWITSNEEIDLTLTRMRTDWSNVYQQKIILFVWIISLAIYFIKWKSLDSFLRLFTLFILVGTLGYSILWFVAFFHHDYYQLVFVLAGVFVPLTVVELFCRRYYASNKTVLNILVYGFCAGLIFISIYHNKNIQRDRYSDPNLVYINPAIFEMESYLNKIGVTKNEKVICAPDPSSNISLNAINRYGFTEVYIDSTFNKRTFNIEKFKSKGANFLILVDSSYFHDPKFEPYLNNKIGEYKGIYVYDLR